MSQAVSFSNQGPVAVITIDNPPVNALSQVVRSGLLDGVNKAIEDQDIEAIVLICAGRTFIAGADISEFGKTPLEPLLPDVLETLDRCPKPVIAALHGTALGGGFETALACRYRVALDDTRVGLPEVKLGLDPGCRWHATITTNRRTWKRHRHDYLRSTRCCEGSISNGHHRHLMRRSGIVTNSNKFCSTGIEVRR